MVLPVTGAPILLRTPLATSPMRARSRQLRRAFLLAQLAANAEYAAVVAEVTELNFNLQTWFSHDPSVRRNSSIHTLRFTATTECGSPSKILKLLDS